MTNDDIYNQREIQKWRFDIFHHFEGVLSKTLDKNDITLKWTIPDILLLTLHESILSAYSPNIANRKLLEIKNPTQADFDDATKAHLQITDSLVSKRIFEWHRIVHWSCLSAYLGSYESVGRELRFLIEDCVQSLRVDFLRPDDTLENKMEWLNETSENGRSINQLRGWALINSTEIPEELKDKLKEIYNELNDVIHPSVDLLERHMRDTRIYFPYCEDSFERSLDMHIRVFDIILALIIFRFPKAAEKFLTEYEGSDFIDDYDLVETKVMCERI